MGMIRCRRHLLFRRIRIAVSLLLGSILASVSDAYPLVLEVEEEKCFKFNIPEDDSAHMVFVTVPGEVEDSKEEFQDEFENYWVSSIANLHKDGGKNIPDVAPALPKDLKDKVDINIMSKPPTMGIFIQKPGFRPLREQRLRFHQPVVLKDVKNIAKEAGQGKDASLAGWNICFTNRDGEYMEKVIFDIVLWSDEGHGKGSKEEKERHKKLVKKQHLTPIEENFEEAIDAANKIHQEMKYMERREQRMRHTADSTNARVRVFSYLSFVVLLGTAWMQISYLKSYFKKKKLM